LHGFAISVTQFVFLTDRSEKC